MVTSDFRPKLEMRPFCACAVKNLQYNRYLWPNCQNFRVSKEIGVEEHDGDVIFFTRSGNTVGSRMRNASGHNYWNSSFIMDVAMGQIPRSAERISRYYLLFIIYCYYARWQSDIHLYKRYTQLYGNNKDI